ncbi:MAG: hypothetical protein LWW95_09415 [Candidatus Desulfofervidus auxilii]|nr:hypothetical protein [Candidatus Desulfofervidus auxilii]
MVGNIAERFKMLDILDIMTTIHSERGIGMGKVVEKIKVINVFKSERAIKIEAVDTGDYALEMCGRAGEFNVLVEPEGDFNGNVA